MFMFPIAHPFHVWRFGRAGRCGGLDDATLDCRIYGLFVTRCSDLPEDNRLVDAFQLAMGLSG